jgi:hypothetical protein
MRNDFGHIFGPSFDGAGDVYGPAQSLLTGQFSESDVTALRKLIPLQNLFYLRWLFDKAQGFGEEMVQ